MSGDTITKAAPQVLDAAPQLPAMLERMIRFLQSHQWESDPITRASLRHEAPSGMITALAEYHDASNLELLARQAWEEAAVYASTYRGPAQAFVLRIYRARGPESVGQFRWLCEGDQGDEGLVLPTQIGAAEAASMLARHLESTQRLMFQLVQDQGRRSAEERAELRAENVQLRSERREMWQVWEEARSAQGERDIAKLQAERAESRKDKALETLKILGPTLGAIIAKKAGLAVQAPPDSELALLRECFSSMKPEQFALFVEGLQPAHQIAILKWLQTIVPEEKQEEGSPGVH